MSQATLHITINEPVDIAEESTADAAVTTRVSSLLDRFAKRQAPYQSNRRVFKDYLMSADVYFVSPELEPV